VRDYFESIWPLINLLVTGSECGVSELAFDFDRCLRKYKINGPRCAEVLNESAQKVVTSHTHLGLLQ
jgi:hypothetical protein